MSKPGPFVYLDEKTVIGLHEEIENEIGVCMEGVLNAGILYHILTKVQSNKYLTLMDKAAFLLRAMAQEQIFFDGNKRTALLTALIFLRVNDVIDDDEIPAIFKRYTNQHCLDMTQFIMDIANKKKSHSDVVAFLKEMIGL